jgi:hypothetical protein
MFSNTDFTAVGALAVCALPLFACPMAGAADPLATATVAVRQTVQCCYREGAMSYVIVHQVGNDHATSRVSRLLAPLDPTLLFQAELDPGVYQIGSFQRPCDGNCDFLDAPVDQCNSGPIELQAGAVVNLLVSVVPFGGCTYSIEDAGA